jgi:prophage antirepressor-like protein
MIEEIKTDNNCIVKAFENNPIAILHEDIDNKKIYYFKASDVGKALNLTNIAVSIQHYDEDERVIRKAYDTTNREQDTTFLTSQGVYRLLYNSKKEIAKKFRKWAGNILDDIIFNESNELKRQIENKDKLLENKDKQLLELIDRVDNIEQQHTLDKRLEKHNFLLNKFHYKKCVYIGEINYNNTIFIKIGSSENIIERSKAHRETYGNFLLLDIFESDHFRIIENDILSDKIIRQHLYKNKINGHVSRECVKFSEIFNYNQYIHIVKTYVEKIRAMNGDQILEKQRLELEDKKLEYEMIYKLIENNICLDIIKNKLENLQFRSIEKKHELPLQVPLQECPLQNKETRNENYNLTLDTQLISRKPMGNKIQKIDPLNFNNFTVYKSMIFVLRAPENKGFQKSGIQTAIKNNRIYKGFRWNFVEKDQDPNIASIQPTQEYRYKAPVIDTIVEINYDKTEITNTFYTKDYASEFLKIAKLKMKKIIQNNELYNNHYYVEYSKCPKELIDNYNKPINRIISNNSKQIKQIHPITKNIIVFNSLSEIYIKFGISSKTIIKAIESKCIYNGFLWEY